MENSRKSNRKIMRLPVRVIEEMKIVVENKSESNKNGCQLVVNINSKWNKKYSKK